MGDQDTVEMYDMKNMNKWLVTQLQSCNLNAYIGR